MARSHSESESAETIATGRQVLEIEARAVGDLAPRLDASFAAAVELLTGCEGRIIVTGMGKSGLICQKIAATLSSTGTPSFFMHPAEAMHGDLGMLVAGDVLVAVSNSGETAEIVRLLDYVRRLGARIIGISGDAGSTLARFADVHLEVKVDEEACSWDLVPTASTTATLALGDALAVAAYRRRGFSSQDFARNHPGGRLARKLVPVEQLMHRGDDLPRIAAGSEIRDAIAVIDAGRLGMTCVVDEAGKLAGILTDGDLRRQLLAHGSLDAMRFDEVITRTPLTIRPDALASEALRLMEERKITSLPVVDENETLRGVIQIHDLWRTELF